MTQVDTSAESLNLGPGARRLAAVLGVVGVVVLVVAVLIAASIDHGAEKFFRAYLINFTFFLSLGLGALFFVLVTHLTRAGWSVALRRIAEVFSWTLLPLALLAVVLMFGIHELYEWSHESEVASDPLLLGKASYLNTGFFIGRIAFYFVVWILTALYFLRRSLAQDRTGNPEETRRMEVRAAPAMFAFALTVTFAAFDLLMSLVPHWYSTIWGVYFFAGSTVGFFSLLAIVLFALQRGGLLTRFVTAEHYHDIGKLVMAFVVFWAYIAFSQYMLIWYANIPEETGWYLERQEGDWAYMSLVLLFGHFVIPFLFLVSRHPKRSRSVLAGAALWVLVMHWLDLYWIVMPEVSPGTVAFGLLDLACFVGIGGLFFGAAVWKLTRHNLIPVKDPRLGESLQFENV